MQPAEGRVVGPGKHERRVGRIADHPIGGAVVGGRAGWRAGADEERHRREAGRRVLPQGEGGRKIDGVGDPTGHVEERRERSFPDVGEELPERAKGRAAGHDDREVGIGRVLGILRPGKLLPPGGHEPTGRLVGVEGDADLPQVVAAGDPASRLAGRLHRREHQPQEHADDRDHHEQLDEREPSRQAGADERHGK